MRWAVEGARLPEVFVAGEGLGRGPVDILGTLLHEAVHALGHVRGIQDTSRQSRYHNRKFRDLAREVGLDVREVPVIGWSQTHVPEITITEYAVVIDALREALTIHRYSEGQVQSTTPPSLPWAPSPAPSAEPPSPPERSARCRLPRTSQPAASRAEGGDR